MRNRFRRPSQQMLLFPLLDTVAEMGAGSRAKEVAAALGQRFLLDKAVTSDTVTTRDGQTVHVWDRHVRFAALKARRMGFLAPGSHAAWRLTDEGQEAVRRATPAVVVRVFTDPAGRPVSAQVTVDVGLPTVHTLRCGDARDLSWLPDNAVPLVVTSIPYFDIVEYETADGQMGACPSYESFLANLDQMWRELYRVTAAGGRMCVNVGDVLRSRSAFGRHHVLPLHADVLVRGRAAGWDALNGILWSKKGTCNYEQGPGGVLGKPGQPGGILKLEYEHILLFRKPGAYRKPTEAQQRLSALSKEDYGKLFRPIWDDIPGARSTPQHPCPFPVTVPERLIRMFSFVGDHVLDPCSGSFSTSVAAMRSGRNSIGVDVAQSYFEHGLERLHRVSADMASRGAAALS